MSKTMYMLRNLLINPRPRPVKPPQLGKIFMKTHLFVRKHFFVIFAFIIFTSIILGFLLTPASIYEEVERVLAGDFSIAEYWRGQPAGWESNPDSWFSYNHIPIISDIFGGMSVARKADAGALLGDHRGFNGPLNPLAFFTEWFYDYTILVPKLLDLGWVSVNTDIVAPMLLKIWFSTMFLAIMILALIPLSAVISFLSPFIIMWLWNRLAPVARVLVIALPFVLVVAYAMGYLDWIPALFDYFFATLINGGTF